jgi:bifunctional non-homologous end joining protein LigD
VADAPRRRPELADYDAKRDFGRTAEPRGGEVRASRSGRLFVVQKHAARNLHYDLRLEFDGVLKSWAVPKGPSLDPAQKPLAVHTEDHPLEYANFEGVIPKGAYGGGTVMVWDIGDWDPIGDPVEGYERGDLKFRLKGRKLRGAWVLARMSGRQGDGGRNWLLIKKRDDDARSVDTYDVLAEEPLSVLTERTLEEIAQDPHAVWTDGGRQETGAGPVPDLLTAERHLPRAADVPGARPVPMPAELKPQLASTESEIKLDGYRLLCRLEQGEPRLITRNGHDWTDRFPNVTTALRRLTIPDAIIDGEVVVLDRNGISDFAALQNAFKGFGPANFVYYVFDIPYADGHDLRDAKLADRKAFLDTVVRAAPLAAPAVQYCEHIVGRGEIVFAQAARNGLEGIISKRAESRYLSKRSASWVKVKCILRHEFVVGGFTDPSGSRAGFGALLVGAHDANGELVYCGRVGTGFSDRQLDDLRRALDDLETKTSPFAATPPDLPRTGYHWIRPELVAEVEFSQWTKEGLVRHPAFIAMREDLDAGDVELDEAARNDPSRRQPAPRERRTAVVSGAVVRARNDPADSVIAGVRISNPGRVVYPHDGVTKGDVASFYAAAADWILPHIAHRPLSLVRCPTGLSGQSFFQRHLGEGFPDGIFPLDLGEKGDEPGIVIRDVRGLLGLVQMGTLEIHPWGARDDNLEKPDLLIFDLDPGPGIEWAHCVASAVFVRDYLERLGLASFAKTSGGKGIHVVVPIVRRTSWTDAKAFTKAIADHIARLAPRNFVSTMTRALRENRVYVDYLRNQRGSTSVAAYSTRARDGAAVSTPLAWAELEASTTPLAFTVRTVPERLAAMEEDPWEGYGDLRQSVTAKMRGDLG